MANPVGVTKIKTLDASQAFFVICSIGRKLAFKAYTTYNKNRKARPSMF